MFMFIRFLLGIIAAFFAFFLANKFSKKRLSKKIYTQSVIIAIVCTVILTFVPFENLCYTFSSPEASFHYKENGTVKAVINGQYSDLIVAENNKIDNLTVIPKKQNGWKLSDNMNLHNKYNNLANGISITLYQFDDTSDYYLSVCGVTTAVLSICDSFNSDFCCIKNSHGHEIYYAHVQMSDEYTLIVNGVAIAINF